MVRRQSGIHHEGVSGTEEFCNCRNLQIKIIELLLRRESHRCISIRRFHIGNKKLFQNGNSAQEQCREHQSKTTVLFP